MTLSNYQSSAITLFKDSAVAQLKAYSSYSDGINHYTAIEAKKALSDISANLYEKTSCGIIFKKRHGSDPHQVLH